MSVIEEKTIEEKNRVFLIEIHPDQDVDNPLENSGSEFVSFSTKDQHDSWRGKCNLSQAFFVDKYEHGDVHYSITKTHQYPDDRWDVSHQCAVIVPSKDLRASANMVARREKKLFLDVLRTMLNSELDEYSKWCNGEGCYFVLKEVTASSAKDDNPVVLREESCGGYLGTDAAIAGAKEQIKWMLDWVPDLQPGVEEPLVSPKPKF